MFIPTFEYLISVWRWLGFFLAFGVGYICKHCLSVAIYLVAIFLHDAGICASYVLSVMKTCT